LGALLGAVIFVAGSSCGGTVPSPLAHEAGADDGAGTDGPLPFGATCSSNGDCESGVCALFGDGTKHCTETCVDATTCPSGSQGPKCNGKGYCAF
jgi:hypothetical protein